MVDSPSTSVAWKTLIVPVLSFTWAWWNCADHLRFHAGQIQPPAGRGELLGVAGDHPEERRAERGAATQPQHHHRMHARRGGREAWCPACGRRRRAGCRTHPAPRAGRPAGWPAEGAPAADRPRLAPVARPAGPSAPCSAAAAASRPRPTPTAAATGSARVAPKVTSSAIFPVWAVFQTTAISPGRSDLTAAKISTAPSVGIATAPTSPDSATRMTQHPEPGEDRRPAGACTGGHVQRGGPDRPADGGAVEQPGDEVADALPDEVAVRV